MIRQVPPKTVDDRALWEPVLLHFLDYLHVYLGILFGLGSHHSLGHRLDRLGLLKNALHNFLACRRLHIVLVDGLLFFQCLVILRFFFVSALVLVRVLVVDAIVEVLIVEFLVCSVKLPNADAKA